MPPRYFVTVIVAAYVVAVALGVCALVLFLTGLRRMLGAHESNVAALVARQDERLAEFAQALNDTLAVQRELVETTTAPTRQPGAHEPTLRMLEQARSQLAVDGAIAMIGAGEGDPTLATVGLSNDEASHVARIGMPDFRGARAIQVVFNDAPVPQVGEPIRAGLVIGLDVGPGHPGTMAVLARARDRRFTDDDVRVLEDVVRSSTPAIGRSLGMGVGDPVPALDPVTRLYDGHAFPALLDREVARARLERTPLSLLLVDVDRLTAINARLGHLGGDRVLSEVADGLRDALPSSAVSARLAGGQYGALLPGIDARDAENLFSKMRSGISGRPTADGEWVSVSAGVAQLEPGDDAETLLDRARSGLRLAKRLGPGSVASSAA